MYPQVGRGLARVTDGGWLPLPESALAPGLPHAPAISQLI